MLKLGESSLVLIESMVDERKSRKAIFVVVHWRSVRSLLIAQPPVNIC